MAEIENPNQASDDDFLRMMGGSIANAMTSEEEKRQMLKGQLALKQREEQEANAKEEKQNNIEDKPEEKFDDSMESNMATGTNISEEEPKAELVKKLPDGIEKPASEYPGDIDAAINKRLEERKVEEKPVEEVAVPEPQVEEKPKKTSNKSKKNSSKEKTVEIVSPEAAAEIKAKQSKPKTVIPKSVDIVDDFDAKVRQSNRAYSDEELVNQAQEDSGYISDDEVNKIIDDSYDMDETVDVSDINVTVVDDVTSEKPEETKAEPTEKKTTKKPAKKPVTYYGGDGKQSAFKVRTAKISNVLRNIKIDNTEEINSTSIESKNTKDRQDIYLKTVLPTLQPSISVVPMIISGVVISMTAFTWPDIREIILIEDKIEDLDPDSNDYIYDKNKYFIDKRRKELELLYKHINSVSGYAIKPSFDDLFGKILKFPDFQQLFFAAYSASFLKPYNFNITCGTCGTDNEKMVNSKDLCFLLNSNININQLNYYIEKGAVMDNSVSGKVYADFQKEKLVEMANSVYRTKQKLPVSSFIFDLKIPTILEALDTMVEIIEVFRDKDLSFTDRTTGNSVFVDSSFGLTEDLMNLRKYLYIHKLIVAQVVDENKEEKTAKVTFVDFEEKQAIINTIYSLSPEDYVTLMNDENLKKLVHVSGIRHAINGGKCGEPTCGAELGNIPVEPEMLFFTIARREYV